MNDLDLSPDVSRNPGAEPDIERARMTDAASKAELAASRRLSRRTGIPLEAALRATLEARAGASGLGALLDARAARRTEEAARLRAREQALADQREEAAARRRARHEGEATAWRAWFDGSARPNPGRCAIGALLRGPGGELVELARPAGYGNSSEAEYLALIAVLETALAHGAAELTVYGDSQVVIDDLKAAQGAPALADYRVRAHALLAQLPQARLRWVPRHRNLEADALSQRAGAALPDVAG